MELRQTAPEEIKEKIKPVGSGGFRFACHPGVPCFTECCRDLNLLLTPYDVMRLKNGLGLSSDEFLDLYTDCGFDENRPLPMIHLQMGQNEARTCPFVTPEGCSVYRDRPSACRIYPIARASRLHRVHGSVLENYFVLHEDHCLGFEQEQCWKIDEWLSDQGLEDYYEHNDLWMAILTHPRLRNGRLPEKQQQMFYLASYNLDKFREMVFNSRFLSLFQIEEDKIEQLRTSETALLKLAFGWMQFSFLGEGTLKLRTQ
ncbi:MAG: YkgJ family cysteine cluster protein [Syntrophobacteraceae bacterium]|jgi:Fe-S-cluster containining protein